MVVTHSEVSRAFAEGATKAKGSRMFIDGNIIYSYGHHFAIAERYGKDGIDYLFNSSGSSVSTSRHKNFVRNEIYRCNTCVIVEIIDCRIENAEKQHEKNIEAIEENKWKAERARKEWTKQYYLGGVKHFKEQNKILKPIIKRQKIEKIKEKMLTAAGVCLNN